MCFVTYDLLGCICFQVLDLSLVVVPSEGAIALTKSCRTRQFSSLAAGQHLVELVTLRRRKECHRQVCNQMTLS